MRAPQFFRTGTGHREGRRPLAAPFTLQISFMQEIPFRRLIRSLSLRPYCLLAPRADQAAAALGPPGFPRLLLPGFQVTGSPHAPAGYSYGAKLRIAPAGLAPASTAASLAAPSPQDSHPLHSHQLAWRTRISPPTGLDPLSVAQPLRVHRYGKNTMSEAVRISVRVSVSPYPGPPGDTAAQYADVEIKTAVLDHVDASPKGAPASGNRTRTSPCSACRGMAQRATVTMRHDGVAHVLRGGRKCGGE